MTEPEYKAIVERIRSGSLLMGIDRASARQFFTDYPISEIEAKTGEPPYCEKGIVVGAFIFAPLALLISLILAIFAFKWWAILVIVASIGLFAFYYSISSVPTKTDMWLITLLLLAAIICHLMRVIPSLLISWYFIALFSSFWASRFLYSSATVFLRSFLLRNQAAFELFEDHIVLRDNYRN